MLYEGKIWVGTGEKPVCLLPQMANRHGLIAGATGTGKTVSLKVLAEGFSEMGVPVFLADVKGDLAGMVEVGTHSDAIGKRLVECGVPSFEYRAFPTEFWDVFGKEGHPVRTTVSEMGPVLLSRLMGLNETQSGVMSIIFRVADDENMLLLDLKDLKAMLAYVGEHAKDYTLDYGNVSMASIGAIQRAVAMIEDEGGNEFFGEPALNIADWMRLDESGRGVINILAADVLYRKPRLYSTFLLWMLSELYELLPECGDLEKPRMVFFFDEAHLLFDDCPKALLETLEQVVRLIRSKGVGVYFITQNPCDIPMSILGQLGNRIQHALRAYTPLDQKAVKTAAMTFRANDAFDTAEAITTLKTGEALVSFLDADGAPCVVERATILPPQSAMHAIDEQARAACMENSAFRGVYDTIVDRVSAYEMLAGVFQAQPTPVLQMPTATPQPVITTAQPTVSRPQAFLTFDPQTGRYVQSMQEVTSTPTVTTAATMPTAATVPTAAAMPEASVGGTPRPAWMREETVARPAWQTEKQSVPTMAVQQAPVAPAVPVAPTAPAASDTAVQQMLVMVYDPTSGQYVQKQMAMQLDPATGNYVPVQTAAPMSKAEQKELEKQRKAAEKAEKERQAEERRQRADELREERAERARKNDSVLGRIQNTAINTATREVTRTVTRGLLGGISGLFGGKK